MIMRKTFPIGFVDKCLSEEKCFFAIRYADSDAWEWGSAKSAVSGIVPGSFVIAPFNLERNEPISIPFKSAESDGLDRAESFGSFPHESTMQEEHCAAVKTLAEFHRKHGGKTVLSRVELVDFSAHFTESLLHSLDALYPSATVFGFYTPQSGLWVGATPELLLSAERDTLHTMALAGTRRRGSAEEWDEKNLEEQRLVVDFILDAMKEYSPRVGTRFTFSAGPVEHLCTSITADCSDFETADDDEHIKSLLKRMSPTPALCGSDRAVSLSLLASLESHIRGAYGGFFGIYHSAANFDFRVNLRSMRIERDKGAIYIGGGITSRSIPDDEWEETCRKSESMKKALENLSEIDN